MVHDPPPWRFEDNDPQSPNEKRRKEEEERNWIEQRRKIVTNKTEQGRKEIERKENYFLKENKSEEIK